jgi:small subunit ribosomal protein S20
MANIRSAEKQRRQAEKRKVRNRTAKSRLKSALKSAKSALAAGNLKDDVLSATFSVVDKTAKRGIIKKNTADRYKSRLAKAAKRTSAAK